MVDTSCDDGGLCPDLCYAFQGTETQVLGYVTRQRLMLSRLELREEGSDGVAPSIVRHGYLEESSPAHRNYRETEQHTGRREVNMFATNRMVQGFHIHCLLQHRDPTEQWQHSKSYPFEARTIFDRRRCYGRLLANSSQLPFCVHTCPSQA